MQGPLNGPWSAPSSLRPSSFFKKLQSALLCFRVRPSNVNLAASCAAPLSAGRPPGQTMSEVTEDLAVPAAPGVSEDKGYVRGRKHHFLTHVLPDDAGGSRQAALDFLKVESAQEGVEVVRTMSRTKLRVSQALLLPPLWPSGESRAGS